MKVSVNIGSEAVIINTAVQTFNLSDIRNRRFMYSGKHRTLILGDARQGLTCEGSHAQEFHELGAPGTFDEYIRGWIGRNSTSYKKGIVHFAPQLYTGTMDEGISFLSYLTGVKGIGKTTKVRGFQNITETGLVELFPSFFK